MPAPHLAIYSALSGHSAFPSNPVLPTHPVLPIISIIVPVLNEQNAIEYAIDSFRVLNKLDCVELIFVDGGSSDDSYTILTENFENVSRASKGRALQMNYGAAQASGEILLFLHIAAHKIKSSLM